MTTKWESHYPGRPASIFVCAQFSQSNLIQPSFTVCSKKCIEVVISIQHIFATQVRYTGVFSTHFDNRCYNLRLHAPCLLHNTRVLTTSADFRTASRLDDRCHALQVTWPTVARAKWFYQNCRYFRVQTVLDISSAAEADLTAAFF